MTDAPKRIWAWESLVGDARIPENLWSIKSTPFPSLGDRATEYVRSDIADELAEALGNLIELSDDHSPFGGEIYQDRVSRVWENAHAALTKYRETDFEGGDGTGLKVDMYCGYEEAET